MGATTHKKHQVVHIFHGWKVRTFVLSQLHGSFGGPKHKEYASFVGLGFNMHNEGCIVNLDMQTYRLQLTETNVRERFPQVR